MQGLVEELHWLDLLACTAIGFPDLVDALGSAVLCGTRDKQAFLSQPCIKTRVEMIFAALLALIEELANCPPMSPARRSWPPSCPQN